MKMILFIALLIVTRAFAFEIELKTGSRFDGKVTTVTPRFVVVHTKIGTLRLTRDMLSQECIQRLATAAQQRKGAAESERDVAESDVEVDIDFRRKTVDRNKENFRRGTRETVMEIGVLDVTLDYVPNADSHTVKVVYAFLAEDKRGRTIPFDKGVKEVTFESGRDIPPIVIESKEVGHVESSLTGDSFRKAGAEIAGYTADVYLDGTLIYRGEED